jgi:hypothetical protein
MDAPALFALLRKLVFPEQKMLIALRWYFIYLARSCSDRG